MEAALKAPHGTHSMAHQDGAWVDMPDINAWIAAQVAGAATGYMLANDEPPTLQETSCGHLKHVLWLHDGAFSILCHSVPRWPAAFPPERIPDPELIYGQSFLRLTLPIEQLPPMLHRLAICDPCIYKAEGVTPELLHRIPAQLISAPVTDAITHMAKSHAWDRDMFADGVVPLCGPVLVESWLRPMNFVEDEGVTDVDAIKWPNTVSYHSRQDHSKWCVASDGSAVWIGSINHMRSQKHRGGDGYLIRDPDLCAAFRALIWDHPSLPYDHVHIPAHLQKM